MELLTHLGKLGYNPQRVSFTQTDVHDPELWKIVAEKVRQGLLEYEMNMIKLGYKGLDDLLDKETKAK